MDAIKSYIMCVLLASAASGILKNLSSGMKNFEKYVGLVCSLTLVIVLATPLSGVISDVKDVLSSDGMIAGDSQNSPETDKNSQEIMAGHVKTALEDTVNHIVWSRFDIGKADIEVNAVIEEDMSVKSIVLDLYCDSDTGAIKSYVENFTLVPTEIRRQGKQ